MEEYRLGPNGAILTALNLFAAQFERVLDYIEQQQQQTATGVSQDRAGDPRTAPPQYIFFDTPGQIEAFTWSASGMIVTETLAAAAEYPTVLLYVVDIPRCVQNVLTFTSNMLYACSILYRSRIPLVVVWNKRDCVPMEDAARLEAWMRDFEAFDAELERYDEANRIPGGGDFSVSFSRSLALALNEFYRQVPCVFVSAYTGEGMDTLFEALQSAKDTFERSEYLRQARERKQLRANAEANRMERERQRFLAAHQPTQRSTSTGEAISTRTESTSRERLRARLEALSSKSEADADQNDEEAAARQLCEGFHRLRSAE
jgi:GTPase Era involved in 16S rRNA processing